MTRGNLNPDAIGDAFDALDGALGGHRYETRQPEQGTQEGHDAWRKATADAGREHCAANGHRSYQVTQRDREPVEVRCPTCGRTWPVVAS